MQLLGPLHLKIYIYLHPAWIYISLECSAIHEEKVKLF